MENKEKRTSAITLYCKAKEVDGKKWTNFLTKKGEEWYKVKFVKGCQPPKIHTILDSVKRAFIGLDTNSTFNVANSPYGKILYIESFVTLSNERVDSLISSEKLKVSEYRETREKEKLSFLAVEEDEIIEKEDLPF